jgi:hypothetical protein
MTLESGKQFDVPEKSRLTLEPLNDKYPQLSSIGY